MMQATPLKILKTESHWKYKSQFYLLSEVETPQQNRISFHFSNILLVWKHLQRGEMWHSLPPVTSTYIGAIVTMLFSKNVPGKVSPTMTAERPRPLFLIPELKKKMCTLIEELSEFRDP